MQELTAGTRVDVAALCPGHGTLGVRVRGADEVSRVPAGLQVWAVREQGGEGPGTALTWGPGGPGAGETQGDLHTAGVTLDLNQLLGHGDPSDPRTDSRVALVAVWPAGPWPPLTLEVRCAGRVVARTPLPTTGLGSGPQPGAVLLARVYRRSAGLRLWIQVEAAGSPAHLERLLRVGPGTFQPAPVKRPPPPQPAQATPSRPAPPAPARAEPERHAPTPTPPLPISPPVNTPPTRPPTRPESPLARLAAAWAALIGETPVPGAAQGPLPPSAPAPSPAPALAPRTAEALKTLEARLLALRRASDEDAEESRREGLLLSPEHARRRARLTGLLETHARIHAEAVGLARRVAQLAGTTGTRRPAEIAEVENAIEQAVRALSAAIDQEAWALAGEPLAQSRARLNSETRFLESLDSEGHLPWDRPEKGGG